MAVAQEDRASSLTILPADSGDHDRIEHLWLEAGFAPLPEPWPLAPPVGGSVVIGRQGAATIAAARIHVGAVARIDRIAVAVGARGAGAGTLFVRRLVAFLWQHGARSITTAAPPGIPGAVDWLTALGFEPVTAPLLYILSPEGLGAAIGEDRETGVDSRWLPRLEAGFDGGLRVTVTYLRLERSEVAAARRPQAPQLSGGARLMLLQLRNPTVSYYRYLYDTVGAPWLWYERRLLDDGSLAQIINLPTTEISVLSVDGVPAGYFELDRKDPEATRLAYFGLMPDFLGHGLGRFLLDTAVAQGLSPPSVGAPPPGRLVVNTCNLDHPRALGLYQKAGFVPYRQERVVIEDPRLDPLCRFRAPLPGRASA